MAIDVDRLLAEALTKHGIRLDPHDPGRGPRDAESTGAGGGRQSPLPRTYGRRPASLKRRPAGSKAGSARRSRHNSRAGAGSVESPARWSRLACIYLGLGSGAGLFLTGLAIGRWVLR